MELAYTSRAFKDLRGLPAAERDRLRLALAAYAADPQGRHDVRPIAGRAGHWRLRSGSWRALFLVEGDRVLVKRVRHRREAYRD